MLFFPKSAARYLILGLFCGLAAPLAAQPLAGSEWGIVDAANTVTDASEDVFIRFEQNGVFVGNGGCNNFRGHYVTNGDAILFGPAAATMMICKDGVSAFETEFFRGLAQVRLFLREERALSLSAADGAAVMTLVQRDAD